MYVEAEVTRDEHFLLTSITLPLTYNQFIDCVESGIDIVIYSEEENADVKIHTFYTINSVGLSIPDNYADLYLTAPGVEAMIELHAEDLNSNFSWGAEGPVPIVY